MTGRAAPSAPRDDARRGEIDLDVALTRAQRGDPAAVADELRSVLHRRGVTPEHRLALLATLATTEYYGGDHRRSVQTCGLACDLAAELGSAGWQAYSLSIRASSLIELDDIGRATDDLVAAELLLEGMAADPRTDPIRGRVRRSLAGSYAELEMFERALIHMRIVAAQPTHQIPDTINLANLHLRWARYLQRIRGRDELDAEWRDHLRAAADGLRIAAGLIDAGPRTWAALVDKMRKETAAQLDPTEGVEPLRALIADGVDTGLANTTAVSLAALVTALRRVGRLDESLGAGRRAMDLVDHHQVYAETATDVLFAVHRTQRQLDVPGASTADAYLAAASGELSQLRQERADAFTARLDHELRRQRLADVDERAHHDPLTGLANRRALDAWLADHPRGPAVLAVVDLDNFKSINDSHGHAAGDAVLGRFAVALSDMLADEATVVRYGGDEFVLVAAGPASLADHWAERITVLAADLEIGDVAPGHRLSASVGVQVVPPGADTGSLLPDADTRMYRAKSADAARSSDPRDTC